jgi:hypothetical protein
MPQVWKSPALTCLNESPLRTATGVSRPVGVLSPS